MYKHLIRPILFTQDAEFIHTLTIRGLQLVSKMPVLAGGMRIFCKSANIPVDLFGLRFPNPIGLAAGMDKEGVALRAWEAMGFGYSEIGAVTYYPQPGNPAPRCFRAIKDEAIVNRMGFNNGGAKALADLLTKYRSNNTMPLHPVGINLGKSKITPEDEAPEDYARSFALLKDLADFFVVNVSCPNQANLRKLQNKESLKKIFSALQNVNRKGGTKTKPILVKISPDLPFETLEGILELLPQWGVAGIVATNTTTTRPQSNNPKCRKTYAQQGGLSGRPLRERSTECIDFIYRKTEGKLPIIGVGGIFSAEDAWEKIIHGASLLQLFSSLVFEGPTVVRRINAGILERMKQHGFQRLQDAVGSAIKK